MLIEKQSNVVEEYLRISDDSSRMNINPHEINSQRAIKIVIDSYNKFPEKKISFTEIDSSS